MSRPSLNTEVYPAISPETLGKANQGKVAVVTGAARGIGKAIAEALAKTGAHVALLDLDVERQSQAKADCERHGVKAIPYACDVTKFDLVEKVFRQIVTDLGPVILVNNAGKNNRLPMIMETFDDFWAAIDLNLKAVSYAGIGAPLLTVY
ncbi:uncharacterized protein A1O5_13364 [Cladophialophora psammophila CBS 110553]|uniref:3-oxoacyl-[acyl-carrier protein] reductase n=1 Tax=Cladophialophora psammophila CBS 110553 TaxID=1182543 RepID=W9VK32_9EURO|nr:uncharacterized protein A1O5_13364 [Cladophialophora psammophila CBS 110553]EXJ53375.1 hypothetical protein A1O5_13364 [Cladophialophora psammophila CBS 110553]